SIACPKAGPNRRLHRSAAPRRAEGHCTGARQRFSLWTVHGPFLFWHDKREMGGASAQPSAWLNPRPMG
ncbi:Helix-turn-helix, partial [Dysosmobacter welbionis]